MKRQTRYQINPNVHWINESNGKCLLIVSDEKDSICLEGFHAAMWRSIWQGYSPLIWEKHIKAHGKNALAILQEWMDLNLITMVID